ncbi:MAG: radical SAM protein [Deltaproteobacteria bacterium]|jgi:radical SAM superfamily enzyme YgiQ (UPF0313 family)|nr:radical SAM protein [Deltaproteobacteria bacterium]
MSWKLKKKLEKRLDAEIGTIHKDWGGKLSICLVYPNTYRVGMGNLAVHTIYDILNAQEDIICERAFLPDDDELEEYERSGANLLSLESQKPLGEFDAVAFTISFENDYLNILPILSLAKIPHRKNERNEHHPVLIAGGAAPTLNSRPLSKIFDRIIPGEFEACNDDLTELFARREAHNAQFTKGHLKDLNDSDTQTTIYSEDVEFGNMHLIEVQRGCPRGCKYCATPSLYRPFRFRNAESVLRMVDHGLKRRKRFGLIGADLLSHPEFVEIATGIHSREAIFSASSVRIDAIDEIRARLLATSKHRSIALGVEAGSQRLRGLLGKRTTDDQALDAAALLAKHGMTKIRLYFMIGLPGETEEDLDSIISLSRKFLISIRDNAPKGKGLHGVDITISPFIPKPNTPFANEDFAGEKYIKEAIKGLKRQLKNERGINLTHDSVLHAASEALLAKGNEDIIDFLEDFHNTGNLKRSLANYPA